MSEPTDPIAPLSMHEQQQIQDAINALGGCWSVNDAKGGERVLEGFLREIKADVLRAQRTEGRPHVEAESDPPWTLFLDVKLTGNNGGLIRDHHASRPVTDGTGFDALYQRWQDLGETPIERTEGRPPEIPAVQKRPFPIQSGRRGEKAHPTSVPWSVADRAYSVYRARYGADQSLERLAERGGFGANEMDDYLPTWREEASEIAELKQQVADLRSQIETLTASVTEWRAWAKAQGIQFQEGRESNDQIRGLLYHAFVIDPHRRVADLQLKVETLRIAAEATVKDLSVALELIEHPATDPMAWIDGARERLRTVLSRHAQLTAGGRSEGRATPEDMRYDHKAASGED